MRSPTEAPAGTAAGGGPAVTVAPRGPAETVHMLAASRTPYLIGVRHHSPALSVVLPHLLDAAAPQVLLIELPAEFAQWLGYLADPATVAPVALAGVADDGSGPAFYPFADFSPELVAIRWAASNGVEVVPCDLPLADRAWNDRATAVTGPAPAAVTLAGALRAAATGRPDDDLWDRTVEAKAPGASAEAIRRAALGVGWALRTDAEAGCGIDPVDLRREAWMRRCLAEHADRRTVALVGSFHAPALLDGVCDTETAAEAEPRTTGRTSAAGRARAKAGAAAKPVVTSLVPYTFRMLDSRSGYPAGIRDPRWQQAVLEAAGQPDAVQVAATEAVVRICAKVRAAGHPSGPAEAGETVRLAVDLARLRGLPAPGRGELVEALTSVVAKGEVLGLGRVLAAAMDEVLIGERRGVLAPGTPRSGLHPAVGDLLAALRLPGPGDKPRDLRLDPLRTDLDRRREIALHRLAACDIPYGEPVAVEGIGGLDALSTRWRVQWTPQTDAMLDAAGVLGVRLDQATEGALRQRRRRQVDDGGPTAAETVEGLCAAAVCGLAGLTAERVAELAAVLPASGSLAETVAALNLLDRLRLGHIPGMPSVEGDLTGVTETLEAAAIRQVDGLAGSTDVADVHALTALCQRTDDTGGGLRLGDALDRLTAAGTPMMAAAAGAVQVLLGLAEPADLGRRIGSWVDMANAPQSRLELRDRLTGVLGVAEPLLHTGGAVLTDLIERIETIADQAFVERLPALRGGFAVLSPAARGRLLEIVHERVGAGNDVGVVDDPQRLLALLLADRAGRAAVTAAGLPGPGSTEPLPAVQPTTPSPGTGNLPPVDRWRLVLGREQDRLPGACRRYATALDELYGTGQGEGSLAPLSDRGGREPSFPTTRMWATELEALFGRGIREEVLASAAEAGRADAALMINPDTVRPSVELLAQVLTLAGAMPEHTVARLRPLVARIVEDLTRQLATRLRPAMAGLVTPRPTYRPGGPLDLARTVRRNLPASRLDEHGKLLLVPEQPVFRSRSRRSLDWRLVLVVDVSGSMEPSVVWSALTSAVLAGVPALTTNFVAFSTDVVDLSDRVDDPLSLLLEVRVGGGTHIAAGLRYARSLVTVPSRTMVVVVSDFEEGYPVSGLLAEVRTLKETGCTLLGCASLDDQGRARYSVSTASAVVAAGMPVAALSPLELARWVADQVRS